ncbi:MAG: SDR family oxidoreductase [Candidatus Riflebacteria bacterium]|nr:SDR family oxidoreductase [Candidatus Riflebacteria bacterium]
MPSTLKQKQSKVQPANSVKNSFDLSKKIVIITGGSGFLGVKHAEAIAEMGGYPVLLDIDGEKAIECAGKLKKEFKVESLGIGCDITVIKNVKDSLKTILRKFGRVDILINNAANNPKMEGKANEKEPWSRLENFPLNIWEKDLAVGLTGAFLCSQVFGTEMAKQKKGVILNIASDLAIIAPDQRLYRKSGLPENEQPVKPVTYSVVKAGLLGLTRYLATYWADKGVRTNALIPGGVYNNQPPVFVEKLSSLIPLGRMANPDEYKAAIIFLVSDASSYMTGASLVIEGGRTCW